MQTTLNTSLVAIGFDIEQPQAIYRNLTSILKGAPISEPHYWENHGLVFQEGQIHVVDHRGDDVLITQVVRDALWGPTLSFQEKAELAIYAKMLFVALDLPLEETSMKFSIIDESNGASMEISLPLSQCSKAFLLTQFWTGNYSENLQAQHQEAVPIVLPAGTTHEDFLNYLNFDTLENLTPDQLSAVLFLCNYFNDVTTGNRCLDLFSPLLPDSRTALEDLLLQTPLLGKELGSRYASMIMNQYIRLRLREENSIQNIVETIQRVPELKKVIENTSFDLDLQDQISSPEDLALLASAIPYVHSLNLTLSKLNQLLPLWGDTLQRLDISNTENITTIPAGFTHLAEFIANGSSNLEDISGLQTSQSLREIKISGTLVTSVSHHYPFLEIFDAFLNRQLVDISGLDGSLSLRNIEIGSTGITRAPHNCPSLERFYGNDSEYLSDISGLNDSLFLQIIRVSRTSISSAPYNCPALIVFEARLNRNLTDISGLSSSKFLKAIDIGSTSIITAPHGCPALEIFHANNALQLNDISGLSGSPSLKRVDIRRTAVNTIPENVHALTIFK